MDLPEDEEPKFLYNFSHAQSIENKFTIKIEADGISRLFPRISLNHIYELLDLFFDLPNRKEIVLRLLNSSIYQNFDHLPDHVKNIEDKSNVSVCELNSCQSKRKDVEGACWISPKKVRVNEKTNKGFFQPPDFSSDNNFDLVQRLEEETACSTNEAITACITQNVNTWLKPSRTEFEKLVDNVCSMQKKVKHKEEVCEKSLEKCEDFSLSNHSQSASMPANAELPSTSKMSNNKPEQEPTVFLDQKLLRQMFDMFPNACPNYIKKLCKGRIMDDNIVFELTSHILDRNDDYPKRERTESPKSQITLSVLKELLSDADPDYLNMKLEEFEGNQEALQLFINQALELRNYPSLKDYERRQQLSAQYRQYTSEFDVGNFLKLIPNPEEFFANPSRKVTIDYMARHYVETYLKNKFNRLPVRSIQSVSAKCDHKLIPTVEKLEKLQDSGMVMKTKRKSCPLPNNLMNIPLLQEIAYIDHKEEINNYFKVLKTTEQRERDEAIKNNQMKTCSCCYDDEILPKNILTCRNSCEFCKMCIQRNTEILYAEGKLDFPCLSNCSVFFDLQTLQSALAPSLFSKIVQKKAIEEVKAAGLNDLEMCPFCDFATIPAEGNKIFSCLNPDCMKESCLLCKEPSHIPLRCDEIEKDDEVKARTYVENKMTEALLRKCWKCGVKFIKEEGCNKMTCVCGALMCYLCKQPVTDYKHFNGNGGDQYHLCPLYSDTVKLHTDSVLVSGAQAKNEIGFKTLKNDPLLGFKKSDSHSRSKKT